MIFHSFLNPNMSFRNSNEISSVSDIMVSPDGHIVSADSSSQYVSGQPNIQILPQTHWSAVFIVLSPTFFFFFIPARDGMKNNQTQLQFNFGLLGSHLEGRSEAQKGRTLWTWYCVISEKAHLLPQSDCYTLH